MALKDKVKDIWKRVSELEDGTDAVNNMAKDKGRIPYKDISLKLKEVMKQNVDVVGRQIIIPSYYALYFNQADRKFRIEVEDVVCNELKEELYHEIRKINPEQNKRDLIIQMQTDPALAEGQFRIEHHIKKPESGDTTIQEKNHIQTPEPEKESDFLQTMVEQPSPHITDDLQNTVVQKPDTKFLYTLYVDSGEETREIGIIKETIAIGRGSKDDVILQSPDFSISRTHATITAKEGNYALTALGVNGTLLNGQELELNKTVSIKVGDEIKIMNYRIKILE